MFYCDPCRIKNGYPYSLARSYGQCEVCNLTAPCFDVHHSQLPKREPTAVELVIQAMDALDDDQRKEVMDRYCHFCGGNTPCRCWDDS